MLNKITLIGRLGREPEPNYSRAGGFFVNFSLEINGEAPVLEQGERGEELLWFNVTVWGEAAKIANTSLHQRSMVYIEGYLTSDSSVSKDGIEITGWEVHADYLELLDTPVHAGEQEVPTPLDRSHAEHLVRTYVEGWKEYNSAKVLSTLDPACVLIEADGELFRGAHTIASELEKRIAGAYGPWHISRWDITALAVAEELCVFEWRLEGRATLEGASLVRFTDNKISSIREYCTTKPLWESSNH